MSAQIVVFAIFAIGAIVAYPKAVAQLVALWLVISVIKSLW